MSWRDRLTPASFGGVKFHTTTDAVIFSKRLQVHQYARTNHYLLENLGDGYRQIDVEAYVIGQDYDKQRDQLIAALGNNEPARLVLPHNEELDAIATNYRVRQSATEGGLATFNIQFIAVYVDPPAETLVDVDGQLTESIAEMKAQQLDDFAANYDTDAPSWKIAKTAEFVRQRLGDVASYLGAAKLLVTDPQAFALEHLRGEPLAVAQKLNQAFNIAQQIEAVFNDGQLVAAYWGLIEALGDGGGLDDDDTINNAINSALITAAAQAIAQMKIAVYDEGEQMSRAFVGICDSWQLNASDPIYKGLQALRLAVTRLIEQRTRGAARIAKRATTAPILVLAHQLYNDATRADEIINRNQIANGLYPPATPLNVLDR